MTGENLTYQIIKNLEKDFRYYSDDKSSPEAIMRLSHTEISTESAKTLDVIRIGKYKSKEFDFLPHIKTEKDFAEKEIKEILSQQGLEIGEILRIFKRIGALVNAYNSEGFYYGFTYCLSLIEQNTSRK